MLVAEKAVCTKAAILDLRATEVEEVAAVLLLILVAVAGDAVVSELLLAVGEGAWIAPALGRCDPIEAQLVADLDAVAVLIVIIWVVLDALWVATVLHVVKDGLCSDLLLDFGVACGGQRRREVRRMFRCLLW